MIKLNVSVFVFCFGLLLPYSPKAFGGNDYPIAVNIYYNLTAVLTDTEGNSSYTGTLINSIKQTLSNANINATFIASPWSRTMRHASQRSNDLIFQMIRTPDREKNFHWIIPLSVEGNKFHLFTRNNSKLLNLTKEEILEGPYTATCRTMSAQCQMLFHFGFPKDRILEINDSELGNLEEFVLRNRADYLVGTKQREIENLNSQLIQHTSLIASFEVSSFLDYLSAPKSINPELLIQIKTALKDAKLTKTQ